jgi:hypothetical protein
MNSSEQHTLPRRLFMNGILYEKINDIKNMTDSTHNENVQYIQIVQDLRPL